MDELDKNKTIATGDGVMKPGTSKGKRRPKVYSYVRFSTPEQSMGRSERRQFEMAERWAKRNGLRLEDQLTDRGLSGYHGDHRTKGALGDFLRQVEEGQIPPGSTLLVENIDRLSREGAKDTLQAILFKIWEHDITLQTLAPEETFDPTCADSTKFMMLIFSIQRAQEESARKSYFIQKSRRDAFDEALETGKIVTAMCPEWLMKVNDYRFDFVPGAAETIRLIFDWKLQGLSQRAMESRLNAEAGWSPPPRKLEDRKAQRSGNGWRTSYIKKILRNRAVIGEYQPHRRVDGKREPYGPPIEDYYPSVIEPKVFHAVQQLLAANNGKGGRTGKKRNILTHIIKCGYCGGPMRFTDKGKPEWRYLVCDNATRGVSCSRHPVRYAEAQDLILQGCRHLKPEQVLPSTDEQTATLHSLRKRIKGEEGELLDIGQRIENYVDLIGGTKNPQMLDDFKAQLEKLYARSDSVTASLEQYQRELVNAESSNKRFKSWKRALAKLMEAISDEDAVELRVRLSAHLREFIECIEVFPVGFRKMADPGDPLDWETRELVILKGKPVRRKSGRRTRRRGKRCYLPHLETIHVTLERFWPKAEQRPTHAQRLAFRDHLLKRRMSKEGRFYRMRFINGERIDIAPTDSIATGLRAINRSVEQVLPDIEGLWREFSAIEAKGSP